MSEKMPLATKYRPKVWKDLVGQAITKQILEKAIETDNIKKAMLFSGLHGSGKTTSARLFANSIESASNNIIEINSANNNSVDDMRQIISGCKTLPVSGKYKIYILDEFHQATVTAQNAFLKILEEPPKHCIFILCTTDPQKIIPTIMSRVTQYVFNKISIDEVVNRLKYILASEEQSMGQKITYDEQSVYYLANAGGGSMRDSITLLDKCLSYSNDLRIETVIQIAGGVDYESMFSLTDAIMAKNMEDLLTVYTKVCDDGADLKQFVKCYLSFLLDVNRVLVTRNFNNVAIPQSYSDRINKYNSIIIRPLLTTLLQLNSSLRWETNPKIVIEGNLIGLL